MKVKLSPSVLCGYAVAPPSKSMAHRLIICAALSGAECKISGLADSDDINATVGCLKALGVTISDGNINGKSLFTKTDTLDCNESGSTLRFLIPLCLMAGEDITLVGSERLFSRSLEVYEDICKENGFKFLQNKNRVTVNGRLKAGKYTVRGDISSQFISGLMFVLPLLSGDSEIVLTGKMESIPYIDMTVQAQAVFGVQVERRGNIIKIRGNQKYIPTDAVVEGDCSNAAFFEALDGVSVTGLDKNTLQGDYIFYDYFEKLKAGRPTLDVGQCPDLAPVLMVVAALNNGATLINTARLKIKESDRGSAMAQELKKLGVSADVRENEIDVGCGITKPTEEILSHGDHRIVMAMAVLLLKTGGVIRGAEAVNKSLPDFFERITALGAKVSYEAE